MGDGSDELADTVAESSSPALPGSRPLANQRARRATSIQTPPLASSDWLQATGFHGERDGIAAARAHWSRALSVVLYKQAFHCTWNTMLCVSCSEGPE